MKLKDLKPGMEVALKRAFGRGFAVVVGIGWKTNRPHFGSAGYIITNNPGDRGVALAARSYSGEEWFPYIVSPGQIMCTWEEHLIRERKNAEISKQWEVNLAKQKAEDKATIGEIYARLGVEPEFYRDKLCFDRNAIPHLLQALRRK